MAGRAIRIFLVDGTPTGLRTVEVGLSVAKAVFAPRGALELLSKRPESRKTGIYVLIGEDAAIPGRLAIYVGEGDDVLQRIFQHDKDPDKDFWDRVGLFVSKDQNLTKAHVRFLESRLVEIANSAKRCTVMNKNVPPAGNLPESDAAEMEEMLEHIRLMATTLGLNAFEPAPVPSLRHDSEDGRQALQLSAAGDGYRGRCVLLDGEFVVLAGSIARLAEAPSLSPSSRALRAEMLATGVLAKADEGLVFTQNYAFGSASGSAQVVVGANINGKATWKLANGTTFKDWHEANLALGESAELK